MFVSALVSTIMPISQTALADIARAEQERLETCLVKTESAPSEAYEDSLAWLSNGNRPKARYCNAMALMAMGRIEESAARLEALATAPDAITVEERTKFLVQAGNAWLSANYPEAAIVALTDALKLKPDDTTIRKDRAAAHLALEHWIEGIDDLDTVLEARPADVEALALRARANLAREQFQAAKADMERARIHEPENIDLLVLRGDILEAIRLAE